MNNVCSIYLMLLSLAPASNIEAGIFAG